MINEESRHIKHSSTLHQSEETHAAQSAHHWFDLFYKDQNPVLLPVPHFHSHVKLQEKEPAATKSQDRGLWPLISTIIRGKKNKKEKKKEEQGVPFHSFQDGLSSRKTGQKATPWGGKECIDKCKGASM